MMSDVRSLKDDGLIKDNNDMKLVSDFHPRQHFFGLVGAFSWDYPDIDNYALPRLIEVLLELVHA